MVSTTSVETRSYEMCPLGGHVHNFHHSERDRSYPPPERGDPSRRKSSQRAAEKRNQVRAYSARQNRALLPIQCTLCRTPGSRAIGEIPSSRAIRMSKTRRQRRAILSMRSGFPLGENPLVLSHHCRGLILLIQQAKCNHIGRSCHQTQSWNCLVVSDRPSFTLLTVRSLESNRAGENHAYIVVESQTTPR